MNSMTPDSGRELKSAQRSNCTDSGPAFLWPGLKLWPKFSMIWRSCSINIMLWINLTSQNSGSQWMWAEQTRIGCATSFVIKMRQK